MPSKLTEIFLNVLKAFSYAFLWNITVHLTILISSICLKSLNLWLAEISPVLYIICNCSDCV